MKKFKVYHDDYSDEPEEIRALCPEDAAIEYAQWYDEDGDGDYSIVIGEDAFVRVVSEDGSETHLRIRGEMDRAYYANEIREKKK